MTVYFFSRHIAQQEMVSDLGGEINTQFPGTISNIRKNRESGKITFTQTIGFGDDAKITQETVEPDAVFVVVAPLPIQAEWLGAGVSTLLAPQNKREVDGGGNVTFNYSGLLHIKKIIVESEQWSGVAVSTEQKAKERALLS
jgi:hypothetical protein